MNTVRKFVVLALALGCLACGSNEQLALTSLNVNGVTREYGIVVPTNPPNGAMPLLVAVHGGGGRGSFPEMSLFAELADQEGLIVVYPQSNQQDGNEGEWQLNTQPDSRHDLDFIEALIDKVSADHAIDPTRVYATGYSLGSMFVYELACHLGSRFAAIASHAGTMPVTTHDCPAETPVALMHLHGVNDTIIPYAESWDWKRWASVGPMLAIPSLIDFWSDSYSCQEQRQPASSSSQHTVHEACDGGVRVEHHRLTDVGHEWPERINGAQTHRLIWNFLSGFSKS